MNEERLKAPYRLVGGPPSVSAYLRLRSEAGLTPRRADQAQAALRGSWAVVHVTDGRETVGMGRLLGDGGWYFHLVDMAVLPGHQRRGLGAVILAALLGEVRDGAPPGATVNLLADRPGRSLYRRFGFTETGPGSVGMALGLSDGPLDEELRPAVGCPGLAGADTTPKPD